MRGEVVNLGNKARGIPLSHWRRSRSVEQKSLFLRNLQRLSKSLGGHFVEMLGREGVKELGMNAGFLLAVLAQRCVSCPAEWDGWLIWTINTDCNWCHFALFLSPGEKSSNQAVWVWSQSAELGVWRDRARGLKCSGYGSSCLERLCTDLWMLLHH